VDFGIRQIAFERLGTGAMNEGSFRPQTTKIGGLCSAAMLAARLANIRFGSAAAVASRQMAQPVYPSSGNTPCVPALALRAHEQTGEHGRSRLDPSCTLNADAARPI
jgi:hypothetical protein